MFQFDLIICQIESFHWTQEYFFIIFVLIKLHLKFACMCV